MFTSKKRPGQDLGTRTGMCHRADRGLGAEVGTTPGEPPWEPPGAPWKTHGEGGKTMEKSMGKAENDAKTMDISWDFWKTMEKSGLLLDF